MTRDLDTLKMPARGEGEGEPADLFDLELLRDWAGFVVRGVGRHRGLAAASFLVVLTLGAGATALFPRTWHVEARLLANRSQAIRLLGNPRSSLQGDDPTRAAGETIFARDNLVALIRQTNLLQRWAETRAPLLRLKDHLVQLVAGPLSPEDQLDAMVGTLDKRLRVVVDAQTVTIAVDWPDPQLAYQIVETAQQNFLELRHVSEMAAIGEALSILEVHAGRLEDQVGDALAELERVRDLRRRGQRALAASVVGEGSAQVAPPLTQPASHEPEPPPRTLAQVVTEQELAQLQFLLNTKRRAVSDLEDFREKRLAELTAQLTEQRVQYADQHPVVQDTRSRLEALRQDSPQLIQLKQDVADLMAEYRRKGGGDPDTLSSSGRSLRPMRSSAATHAALSNAELADDPQVDHARTSLRMATAQHEDLMMRIDAARIELDTARAAFKYRYSVVRPAAVPRKPVKPNVGLLLIATLGFALGLAALSGAASDLWSGRFVEPWQVERGLGLEVLAQVTVVPEEEPS